MINLIYKAKVNGKLAYFCHETKSLGGGKKEHVKSRITKSFYKELEKDKSVIKLSGKQRELIKRAGM